MVETKTLDRLKAKWEETLGVPLTDDNVMKLLGILCQDDFDEFIDLLKRIDQLDQEAEQRHADDEKSWKDTQRLIAKMHKGWAEHEQEIEAVRALIKARSELP